MKHHIQSIIGKGQGLRGIAALACLATAAHAGGTMTFGQDKSVSIGGGLRASISSTDASAPDGTSRSTDFNLDSIRLYTDFSLNKIIKGTFNVEKGGDNSVQVMDAIGRFEFSDGFNIWVGRMLPPSDRSNLDGPYYLNTWSFPMGSQYPAKFAGRDNGATVWGKLADKKLVYAVGAYQGHNRFTGASNQSAQPLYAGRIQFNFWDAEPNPAYYCSSTYYGGKEILALGVASQSQKDGVGTAAKKGDYKGLSVDGLMETKAGIGWLTVEAAYYKYDTGGVVDFNPPSTAAPTANLGGITQGPSNLFSVAYLVSGAVGAGRLQPVVRYQKFDADLAKVVTKRTDAGLNYIIEGHNARISATFSKIKVGNGPDTNAFILGTQLQF